MDWLGIGDLSYTTLGTGVYYELAYEKCYGCEVRSGKFQIHCHCDDVSDDECWCEEGKPRNYSVTLVQCVGFPVPTIPADTTFRIRGWHRPKLFEVDADPSYFAEKDPDIDLVLEPTVDAADMDHAYVHTLRPFVKALMAVEPATMCDFKGAKTKQSYINAFKDRLTRYMLSQDREPQASSPPHVKQRRKGHSHAR